MDSNDEDKDIDDEDEDEDVDVLDSKLNDDAASLCEGLHEDEDEDEDQDIPFSLPLSFEGISSVRSTSPPSIRSLPTNGSRTPRSNLASASLTSNPFLNITEQPSELMPEQRNPSSRVLTPFSGLTVNRPFEPSLKSSLSKKGKAPLPKSTTSTSTTTETKSQIKAPNQTKKRTCPDLENIENVKATIKLSGRPKRTIKSTLKIREDREIKVGELQKKEKTRLRIERKQVKQTIASQVGQSQAGAKRRRGSNKKHPTVSEETSDILLAGYAKEIG